MLPKKSTALSSGLGSVVPLAKATYRDLGDHWIVTLTPLKPLKLGQFYVLTVNGPGTSGVSDTLGNPLDGFGNGVPNGIYSALVYRGTSVRPVSIDPSHPFPKPPRPKRSPISITSTTTKTFNRG